MEASAIIETLTPLVSAASYEVGKSVDFATIYVPADRLVETCRALRAIADEVICARTPAHFSAVGEWYRDFAQTTDDEVTALLSANR